MISIIDYGVGNLNSVKNMLEKCGIKSEITNDEKRIKIAKKIILPGVGAYDTAMNKLSNLGLIEIIKERVSDDVSILGICLGAQLLLEYSEEGDKPGLGLIKGFCKKFDSQVISPLRTPHMGWSDVLFKKKHVLNSFLETPRFYFVHSYCLTCSDPEDVLATSNYGQDFTCAINRENVSGVQFHPEKSHRYGAQLLRNFALH